MKMPTFVGEILQNLCQIFHDNEWDNVCYETCPFIVVLATGVFLKQESIWETLTEW